MTTWRQMNLLEGRKVTKSFGGLVAVDNVDFNINEGEILGLIGPNGAGKTTLLNLINGIESISKGEILYQGHRLNHLKPDQIARIGIARAFQIVRTFEGMTVKENVMVGALFGSEDLNKRKMYNAEKRVEEVLEYVHLYNKKDFPVNGLTIPDRKRVELGRALASRPKLLLLDEVMAGLNQSEVTDLMRIIENINKTGITILMIEHIMKAVMGMSHRILVLHHGKRICLGRPKEIAEDEKVIQSYLGERFGKVLSSTLIHGEGRINYPIIKTMDKDILLELSDVTVAYGDIIVLWDINLAIRENEIVGIVGANSAGKSTMLKTISGLLRNRSGRIRFNRSDITNMEPSGRVRIGITQIPEGRQLFSGLTVRQNLLMGAFMRGDKAKIEKDLQWVFGLFPMLGERRDQLAGTLSGGEQQMCAIGRGLMSSPRILLIDELSLGLAPIVVDRLIEAIKKIHSELKLTMILVEQDVKTGLDLSDRGYVLETGRIIKEGDPQALLADPEVKRAYLGA